MEIVPFLPGLLTAFAVMSVGMLSPGPNILAVIGTAMERGRASGVALAIGISVGSIFWALLTVLGFTALITLWAGAMNVLKLAGAAYLLWLAWGAFRAAATPGDRNTRAVAAPSLRAYVLRGLAIQMSNPKAAFTWLAIATLGIGGEAPASVAAVLVIGCGAISLGGHVGYAALFSTARATRAYARVRRPVQTLLGAFFTYAAFRLATDRS